MKSLTGHCMGAASALEAIACVMTLETGIVPSDDRLRDPRSGVRPRRRRQRRPAREGGRRPQQLARVRRLQRRRLLRPPRRVASARAASHGGAVKPRAITGLGIVSPLGMGREPFFRAMAAPHGPGRRAPLSRRDVRRDQVRARRRRGGARVRSRRNTWATRGSGRWTASRSFSASRRASRCTTPGSRRTTSTSSPRPTRWGSSARTRTARSRRSPSSIASRSSRTPATSTRRSFPNTVANSASGYVSIWEDLRALNVSVSDGNCGALDAVACGDIYLDAGRAEALLVGGGEAISEPLFVAFLKLGALAADAPAVVQGGTRLGEGAAFFSMEPRERAAARGARVRAEVTGYGTAFVPPESEASLIIRRARRPSERSGAPSPTRASSRRTWTPSRRA